jgi:hypothetical protein
MPSARRYLQFGWEVGREFTHAVHRIVGRRLSSVLVKEIFQGFRGHIVLAARYRLRVPMTYWVEENGLHIDHIARFHVPRWDRGGLDHVPRRAAPRGGGLSHGDEEARPLSVPLSKWIPGEDALTTSSCSTRAGASCASST